MRLLLNWVFIPPFESRKRDSPVVFGLDSVQLEILQCHPQFIFTQIKYGQPLQSLQIAFVYENPNKTKRTELWGALKNTVPIFNIPRMVVGDFNALLSVADKKGGSHLGWRCPHFGNFLDDNNLYDLGFRGPPFTWQRGNTFEKLDRAIGNLLWLNLFLIVSLHTLFVLNPIIVPFTLICIQRLNFPGEAPFGS